MSSNIVKFTKNILLKGALSLDNREFKGIKENLNLSQLELANRLGISQKQVSNYLNGVTKIPEHISDKLKNLVNITRTSNTQSREADLEVINIPYLKDFRVSAGRGVENFNDELETIPFNKKELQSLFHLQSVINLSIAQVIGDSMYPTLKEGERVLFQNDGSAIEGAIYIIEYDNEIFIKRLKKRPLELISDNKEYNAIKINDLQEIKILGRVIGSYSFSHKVL